MSDSYLKLKKNYAICFLMNIMLIVLCNAAYAQQLTISNINVAQFQSQYISDYERNASLIQMDVYNPTQSVIRFKISGYLKLMRENRIVVSTIDYKTQIYTIAPNERKFFRASEILDKNSLDINKNDADLAVRTNRIPEGDYQLCVKLIDIVDFNKTLASYPCKDFQIITPKPPQLIYPMKNGTVFQPYPAFSWSPVFVVNSSKIAKYIITICKLFPGQTERQAIETNSPIVKTSYPNLISCSFMYPSNSEKLGTMTDTKDFVWQVQAVDENGEPIGENMGKSEIWKFSIGENTPPPILVSPNNESVVNNNNPGFEWSHNKDNNSNTFYKFTISKLKPNQNPEDAITNTSQILYASSNIPAKSLINLNKIGNNYIYNLQGINLESIADTNKFVWQIQCVNQVGQGVGINEGKSPAWTFKYQKPTYTNKSASFNCTLFCGLSERFDQTRIVLADSVNLRLVKYIKLQDVYDSLTVAYSTTDVNGQFSFKWLEAVPIDKRKEDKYFKIFISDNRFTNPIDSFFLNPNDYIECKQVYAKTRRNVSVYSGIATWKDVDSLSDGSKYPLKNTKITLHSIPTVAVNQTMNTKDTFLAYMFSLFYPVAYATTDDNGRYSFEWVNSGGNRYQNNKDTNYFLISVPNNDDFKQNIKFVNITPGSSLLNDTLSLIGKRYELYVKVIGSTTNGVKAVPNATVIHKNRDGKSNTYITSEDGLVNLGKIFVSGEPDENRIEVQHEYYDKVSIGYRNFEPGRFVQEIRLTAQPPRIEGIVKEALKEKGISNATVALKAILTLANGNTIQLDLGNIKSNANGTFIKQLDNNYSTSKTGAEMSIRGDVGKGAWYTTNYTIDFISNKIIYSKYTDLPPYLRTKGFTPQLVGSPQTETFIALYTGVASQDGFYPKEQEVNISKGWEKKPNQFIMSFIPGKIKGIVTDDISNAALNDVQIKDLDYGIDATTDANGKYELITALIKNKERKIVASKIGYYNDTIKYQFIRDSIDINIKLRPISQNFVVKVIDKDSLTPIEGALVQLIGDPKNHSGKTNNDGNFKFERINTCVNELSVYAENYTIEKLIWPTKDINRDSIYTYTVYLKSAGSISGIVTNSITGLPILGASISITGVDGTITTDSNGYYKISNVAIGEQAVKAGAPGYAGSPIEYVNIAKAQETKNVNFQLVESQFPIEKILGFKTIIDTIEVFKKEGKAYITGYLTDIKNNAVAEIKDNVTLHYKRVEIDIQDLERKVKNIIPSKKYLQLQETELRLKLFKAHDAIVRNINGIRIALEDAQSGIGAIRDSLYWELNRFISNVPGSFGDNETSVISDYIEKVEELKTEFASTFPFLSASGTEPKNFELKFNCAKMPKLSLWNVEFRINCDKSKINIEGVDLAGSVILNLKYPKIDSIEIKQVKIGFDGSVRTEVKIDPKLVINILNKDWRLEVSGAKYNEKGFALDGDFFFKIPDDAKDYAVKFLNLGLSKLGFTKAEININFPLNLYDLFEFQPNQKTGFSLKFLEDMFAISGSGSFKMPKLNWEVSIPKIMFDTKGNFEFNCPVGEKFSFFNVLSVNLKGLTLNKSLSKYLLDLDLGMDFDIPQLGIKLGKISIGKNNYFRFDSLGLRWNIPGCIADVTVYYNEKEEYFGGSGTVSVGGSWDIYAAFEKGKNRWGIEFRVPFAGAGIPIFPPVMMTSVGGGVKSINGKYEISLLGSFAFGSDWAVKANCRLSIQGGPIVKGSADITALNDNIKGFAHTEIELNVPERRFIGNTTIDVNFASIITAKGTAGFCIDIKNQKYYISASANISVLRLLTAQGVFALGWNYDLPGVGNIKGMYFSTHAKLADIGFGFNCGVASLGMYARAEASSKIYVKYNLTEAWGESSFLIAAGFNASIAGFGVSANGSVQGVQGIGYNVSGSDKYFYIDGGFKMHLDARVGGCDPSCNSIDTCWGWPPAGVSICIDLGLRAKYDTRTGFNLSKN